MQINLRSGVGLSISEIVWECNFFCKIKPFMICKFFISMNINEMIFNQILRIKISEAQEDKIIFRK